MGKFQSLSSSLELANVHNPSSKETANRSSSGGTAVKQSGVLNQGSRIAGFLNNKTVFVRWVGAVGSISGGRVSGVKIASTGETTECLFWRCLISIVDEMHASPGLAPYVHSPVLSPIFCCQPRLTYRASQSGCTFRMTLHSHGGCCIGLTQAMK